jgi:hypothetical protein
MQDFINFVMLVLASIASMLLGVLAAYGICKSAFSLMHWHANQNTPAPAKPSPEPARAS